MLNAKSSNLTPSSHTRKLWLLSPLKLLWPSHKTNTTESTELLDLFMKLYLISLKVEKSANLKISRSEVRDLLTNSDGKRTIPLRSGASDLTMLDPTWLSTSPRESNTWTKSKSPWSHLSKTPLNKESFASKPWEVWDLTSPIASYTLTPSTEEEDKSCHQPEDFIMPSSCSASHLFLNLSSVATSLPLQNVWVVSINLSIREEVKSSRKSRLLVLHWTSYFLCYLGQILFASLWIFRFHWYVERKHPRKSLPSMCLRPLGTHQGTSISWCQG